LLNCAENMEYLLHSSTGGRNASLRVEGKDLENHPNPPGEMNDREYENKQWENFHTVSNSAGNNG
jgi:hypothetical protein